MLTVKALSISDGVVIPMQCEFYSLEGMSQLMNTVKKIRQLYNPNLQIVGMLLTMYNGRLTLTGQVVAELKKYYEDILFKAFLEIGRIRFPLWSSLYFSVLPDAISVSAIS